eukprot:scaffold93467_cov33-Tisochrysis_lutea.AAC.1
MDVTYGWGAPPGVEGMRHGRAFKQQTGLGDRIWDGEGKTKNTESRFCGPFLGKLGETSSAPFSPFRWGGGAMTFPTHPNREGLAPARH